MNTPNKLYTIQFFSLLDDWSAASHWTVIAKCQTRKFCKTSEKDRTPGKKRPTPRQEKDLDPQKWEEQRAPCPAPQRAPVHKLSTTSMVWNNSIGLLGCLSGCAPCQLLPTCSSAEYEKLEKGSWFHSNNWKHQCYQHFSCSKCRRQQLLRGKLTLSQLKPGQVQTCRCSLDPGSADYRHWPGYYCGSFWNCWCLFLYSSVTDSRLLFWLKSSASRWRIRSSLNLWTDGMSY